jgi:LuxR family maltose regulon positive regulatory protein
LLPGRGHEEALGEFRAVDQRQDLFVPPKMVTVEVRGLLLQAQARLGQTATAKVVLAGMPEDDRNWGEMRAALAAAELVDGNAQAALEAVAPVLDGSAPVVHVVSLVQALLLDAIAHDRRGDERCSATPSSSPFPPCRQKPKVP